MPVRHNARQNRRRTCDLLAMSKSATATGHDPPGRIARGERSFAWLSAGDCTPSTAPAASGVAGPIVAFRSRESRVLSRSERRQRDGLPHDGVPEKSCCTAAHRQQGSSATASVAASVEAPETEMLPAFPLWPANTSVPAPLLARLPDPVSDPSMVPSWRTRFRPSASGRPCQSRPQPQETRGNLD